MGIPKTRKKLSRGTEKPETDKAPVKIVIESDSDQSNNLDYAFEIVDHIEKESEIDEHADEKPEPVQSVATETDKYGFRWHISLEAIMPDDKKNKRPAMVKTPEKSQLIDFNFTVPFFWRLPIIGKMTRECVVLIDNLLRKK